MKAILIDPAEHSIEYVETPAEVLDIRRLIGCDGFDEAFPFGTQAGEVFYVNDNGALQTPPLAHFMVPGYRWRLFGRALVLGFDKGGKERSTNLTVEALSRFIKFP
jgi:hypothetical protein